MAIGAKYHSAHLHLHSCFESSASMGGHCFQAKKLGVDVVWITDHDSRICRRQDQVFRGDDFEKEQLAMPGIREGQFDGWRVDAIDEGITGEAQLVKGISLSGEQSMQIRVMSSQDREEWGSLRVSFATDGKRHQSSLMTGVSLSLALRPEKGFGDNGRLRIRVGLSQQPLDLMEECLTYVAGESDGEDGTISLGALKKREWSILRLDVTNDAIKHAKGGVDNVFGVLSLLLDSRRGELVELYVDDFRLDQTQRCQAAFDRQKRLAAELSHHCGVTIHIGTEISASGHHKTAFGSWIPILNRNNKPEGYSADEAVAHIKSLGGAVSLNHPFSEWKRKSLTEEEREQVVQSVLDYYGKNRCQGADLIEVGFPEGRHGFPLTDYLKLWDGLSLRGIVIAGIGVSDAHNNRAGWDSGNNFVNWIRSETTEEQDVIRGLLSGDIWMSDPMFFRGQIGSVTAEGTRMGQVAIGTGSSEVEFRMTGCRSGWKVHWIVDGVREETLDVRGEKFEFPGVVNNRRNLGFTRFEAYEEHGRCILLTNPIYFARSRPANLPPLRLAQEYTG